MLRKLSDYNHMYESNSPSCFGHNDINVQLTAVMEAVGAVEQLEVGAGLGQPNFLVLVEAEVEVLQTLRRIAQPARGRSPGRLKREPTEPH
jgi:hypothetical protein